MNDNELDRLAADVVRRVLRNAHARAGAPPRAAAGAMATHPSASGPARPLEDISWRGPQVQLGAWTPAAGPRRVADFVDHTLLKAEATRADIVKLCAEAREHRFAAVCVNPVWVDLCAAELALYGLRAAAPDTPPQRLRVRDLSRRERPSLSRSDAH